MNQPIWLSEKIVKAIQIDQLKQHGGIAGIREENLLSASLAKRLHLSKALILNSNYYIM